MDQVRMRAARMGLADAPVALAAATCVATSCRTLDTGPAAGRRRHRFDPDDVPRALEAAPGHGRPGAHGQLRSGPLGQATRGRAAAGRPRHQGRPDRRAQAGRAYGRCRALFRGRARPPVPHPARGEEPLRPDRRDRRLRDDRGRAGRSRQSRPRCSWATARPEAPGAAVFAGIEGTRPLAGGDSGAGGSARLRHPAPGGGGLGFGPAGHDPGGAGCPRRAWNYRARCLSERCRRAEDRRAGGRSGGGGGAGLQLFRPVLAARTACFSGKSACRAMCARRRKPNCGSRRPAKLGFTTAVVPPGTKVQSKGLKLKPIADVGELVALAGGAEPGA